jgi:8-oxo-dGTP diphosphatase
MEFVTRVLVVAGVIERDGKILIAQRRRGGRHELKWEFPGGKVEPGEEPHAALERELREELAIEATIGEEMAREQVAYPGRRRIELIFYRVTEFQGEPQNLDFEQIVWAARDELQSYDFLEGDLPFVTKLARGTLYN